MKLCGLPASVPATHLCQGSSGPPWTAGRHMGVAMSLEDSLHLCKQWGAGWGPWAGRASGEDRVGGGRTVCTPPAASLSKPT